MRITIVKTKLDNSNKKSQNNNTKAMLTDLQEVLGNREAILAFAVYIPPSSLAKVQFSNISVFLLWGLFNQSLLNVRHVE